MYIALAQRLDPIDSRMDTYIYLGAPSFHYYVYKPSNPPYRLVCFMGVQRLERKESGGGSRGNRPAPRTQRKRTSGNNKSSSFTNK